MGKTKPKMPRAAGEGQDAGAGGEGAGEAGAAKKPTETTQLPGHTLQLKEQPHSVPVEIEIAPGRRFCFSAHKRDQLLYLLAHQALLL